ncbi:MAG: InlB B-repeat-containing protein, partial [Bacilli bacterium]|nr:InlB B-repeat-containing protein [Bacilli bacterium]
MGKRKIVLLSATAAFFAVCVGCIIHSPDVASSIRGGYAGSEMAINFTAAENKLYEGARVLAGCEAGENAAVTERGTPIGFAYKGLVNPSGQWQAIRQNGYIANTDKIGGMSALTIKQKTASSADLKVYWSDVPLTFDDGIPTSTHYQSFSGIADLEFVCDFDGYRPNYFSVVGVGTSSSIESMSLSFSCQNQYPTLNIAHDEAYGSVTGAGIHKIGESFDLVATANEGRRFVGWYAGSVLLSEDAAFRFTMPECIDHYDIEARYALDQFDMVATSNDATKGTVTGSGPYDYGETVTLAASPEDGYGFRGWYKNGSLVSTDNPYAFPMPAGSLNLVGQFSENDYEVTLSCDSSKGSVSGAGTYRYKQSVTLSASPKEGYSFAGWYEGETQISPDAQFAFAIPSHDLSYEARFTINSWEVSLASKEYKGGAYIDGSNAGSVSGAGAYAYGTQVELTAIPNEGYGFAGWFDEDGELVSESPTHSFAMPDNAVDLEARFAKLYTATVETDGEVPEGCVLPEGGQYRYGQEVSLSLPEEYRCEWWDAETFDVVAEGTDYAFTMPERDLDLILTAFEKNPYFGSYPQTEVTDSGLIAALNSAAGTLPTAGNATVGNWTSYNYYIFSSVSHFMWHADIEHADGNKYRGVYFTSYRPYYTTYSSSASNSYQDDNGYNTNTVYWFK